MFRLTGKFIKERNEFIGYILSEELIEALDNKLVIPDYQRGRVGGKKKAAELTEIFNGEGKVPPLTLNLQGTYRKVADGYNLSGVLRVIDGQQRLRALQDTRRQGLPILVSIHDNLSSEKEIELYKQQTKQTPMSFGEKVKARTGPMAQLAIKAIDNKRYPIKLTPTGSRAAGLPLQVFAPVQHWVYTAIVKDSKTGNSPNAAANLLNFYDRKDFTEKEIQATDNGLKSLFSEYANIFGVYDQRSVAYRRTMLLAVMHVMVDNFLTPEGVKMETHYDNRLRNGQLLRSSVLLELTQTGSDLNHVKVYNDVVEFLNKGRKSERLPTRSEFAEEETWEDVPTINSEENINFRT